MKRTIFLIAILLLLLSYLLLEDCVLSWLYPPHNGCHVFLQNLGVSVSSEFEDLACFIRVTKPVKIFGHHKI